HEIVVFFIYIFIRKFFIKLKTAGLPVVFNRLTEPRTSGVNPNAHLTYKCFSGFGSSHPQKANCFFMVNGLKLAADRLADQQYELPKNS
nr:hypothetical protein [bacterium]